VDSLAGGVSLEEYVVFAGTVGLVVFAGGGDSRVYCGFAADVAEAKL
jgi:hypothetical protein